MCAVSDRQLTVKTPLQNRALMCDYHFIFPLFLGWQFVPFRNGEWWSQMVVRQTIEIHFIQQHKNFYHHHHVWSLYCRSFDSRRSIVAWPYLFVVIANGITIELSQVIKTLNFVRRWLYVWLMQGQLPLGEQSSGVSPFSHSALLIVALSSIFSHSFNTRAEHLLPGKMLPSRIS